MTRTKNEPAFTQNRLIISVRAFDLFKTGKTDLLSLEFGNVGLTAAEIAARMILGEYDLVAVNVYLNRVGARNIHFVADLLGNNDSAELINVSYYTG